jgi:hypothetical protein
MSWALAIHESAHAVLSTQYGLAVTKVTILPAKVVSALTGEPEGTLGHVAFARPVRSLDEITKQVDAEINIKKALAGPIAEHRFDPNGDRRGWCHDLAGADALIRRFWPNDVDYWTANFWHEAACDVKDAWPRIMRVAEVLIERKTLSGPELWTVLVGGELAPSEDNDAHNRDQP